RELLHGEAAVLGDDQRAVRGERLAQLRDGLPFGLSRHGCLLVRCARPVRGGGAAPWSGHSRKHDDAPATAPVRLAMNAGARPPLGWRPRSLPRRARRRPRCSSPSDRSDPADQAPTVTPISEPRSAGAGCLWLSRRSSVVGRIALARPSRGWWPP